jgi:hypothetical protein
MDKVHWADMTDDDPIEPYVVELEIPVVISKHGIKVKKSVASAYVPPHRQNKNNE